jgi:hypothetical protein
VNDGQFKGFIVLRENGASGQCGHRQQSENEEQATDHRGISFIYCVRFFKDNADQTLTQQMAALCEEKAGGQVKSS